MRYEPKHLHHMDGVYHPDCKRCELERAAPDLLEACKVALIAGTKVFDGNVEAEQERVISVLKEAIAKAAEQRVHKDCFICGTACKTCLSRG